MTEGFALPVGSRMGPNCGVTAVAVAARVPFNLAWDACRNNKRANWKGRTSLRDRLNALRSLGVPYEDKGTYVYKRQTLQTYVRRLDPSARYMITTTGHVQMVEGEMVLDQHGVRHVSEFWGRRKLVLHVIRIL
jgi:hypothetical protein